MASQTTEKSKTIAVATDFLHVLNSVQHRIASTFTSRQRATAETSPSHFATNLFGRRATDETSPAPTVQGAEVSEKPLLSTCLFALDRLLSVAVKTLRDKGF